jgi:transposase
MSTRRTYTPEFKREAVRLAQTEGVTQTARNLDVNRNLVQTWKKELGQDPEHTFPGQGSPRDPEMVTLQRQLKRLQEENAILKKAVGIFSTSPR